MKELMKELEQEIFGLSEGIKLHNEGVDFDECLNGWESIKQVVEARHQKERFLTRLSIETNKMIGTEKIYVLTKSDQDAGQFDVLQSFTSKDQGIKFVEESFPEYKKDEFENELWVKWDNSFPIYLKLSFSNLT